MVSAAPVTFLMIAAFMFAGVWWWHRERIRNLKELIEVRDAKIRDFQEKTKSDTPDDAAKRMDALEQRIDDVAGATLPYARYD